jgi:uncharacterized protein (DUF1330 family)
MKKLILAITLISASLIAAAEKPHTVLHVITVKWKDGTTKDQIAKAMDAVDKLGKEYPGIKRVWLRSIKVQGDKQNAIVMEFESEKSLKDYVDSPAQKHFYEVYLPLREESTTFDITN